MSVAPHWNELPAAQAWTVRLGSRDCALTIEGSSQPPQHAHDGSCETVFDGFLFNRQELSRRPELEGLRWENDAGLLLHLYARLGPSVLSELRGVFTFILWNAGDRTLVATRDPLGIHPLFYARTDSGLALSWSIDSLLNAGASREVNRVFVAEHLLRRWRSLDETYFSAIRRVPAGHYLRFMTDRQLEPYWHPAGVANLDFRNSDAWLDELETRLEQAVERCLELGRAGIYLSGGGVDSTSVALAAARISGRRGLPAPVALSVSFPDPAADEDEEQQRVASALGLPRYTCPAEGRDSKNSPLIESSLDMAARRGAPIGTPWHQAFLMLAREARNLGCSVVLTGDGGDEWLTVPKFYAADLLRQLEFRELAAFLSRKPGGRRSRAVVSELWESALRPLLHRVVTRRLARVTPSLHARYRRSRHPLPRWLAPDERLRAALQERLDTPAFVSQSLAEEDRESTLRHPEVSMYFEDWFTTGRRVGIPVLHPFWDVDVVALLYSASPEVLQLGGHPKGLAVTLVKRRLATLGDHWPRKAAADVFLEQILAEGLAGAWSSIGGLRTLGELGIVDAKALEEAIQADESEKRLPLREAWAIVTSESWLRTRIDR